MPQPKEALLNIPKNCLSLGTAEDGLPILLNLSDPVPGPLLVSADAGGGKTAFLKNVATGIMAIHDPEKVQFGVITPNPETWSRFDSTKHCDGIYPIYDTDYFFTLGDFIKNHRLDQFRVLLLEGFEKTVRLSEEKKDTLRWLLSHGPARHLWPIVSLDPAQRGNILPWLDLFRTRIFGKIEDGKVAEAITGGSKDANLGSLQPGVQFTMREGLSWTNFWIPRLT